MSLVYFTEAEEDFLLEWIKNTIKTEESRDRQSIYYPLMKTIITKIEGEYGRKSL